MNSFGEPREMGFLIQAGVIVDHRGDAVFQRAVQGSGNLAWSAKQDAFATKLGVKALERRSRQRVDSRVSFVDNNNNDRKLERAVSLSFRKLATTESHDESWPRLLVLGSVHTVRG
jgi:hypothetical protein